VLIQVISDILEAGKSRANSLMISLIFLSEILLNFLNIDLIGGIIDKS